MAFIGPLGQPACPVLRAQGRVPERILSLVSLGCRVGRVFLSGGKIRCPNKEPMVFGLVGDVNESSIAKRQNPGEQNRFRLCFGCKYLIRPDFNPYSFYNHKTVSF